MIKISTGTTSTRIITFLLCCFPLILVLANILFRNFGIEHIIFNILITGITISVAYRIAFNDYEIWFSKTENCIIMKKRERTVKYDVNEFLTFRLENLGLNMSSGFRYYRLKVGNRSYRIRHLLNENNEEDIFDSIDPALYMRKIESEIKNSIRDNMNGAI
jgi:hypothetical protein